VGITPQSSKIPISLTPGGSMDYMLFINETGVIPDKAKDGYIQMAIKTELGVLYFQDKLPAYMLFHEDGTLGKIFG